MPTPNIQMVDTRTQYLAIREEVDAAINDVLDSAAYINGPAVKRFSANLATYMGEGVHVIPCANGTDALQIAFMALGLQRGDEVLTPSFTYIATVEAAALLGLRLRFVEVDPQTFNLNPSLLENYLTANTKAIVPVHLYGQSADMEPIMQFAKKHNLFVVEDTAQAIGATYTFSSGEILRCGTIGDIGTTSFYPSKNLGAFGDGGAIFTRDAALAERLTMMCNHGQRTRYLHDEIGCNSRLDSIQAAILNVKLGHLDTYNASRRRAAHRYNELFANVSELITPFEASYGTHVYHQYTLRVKAGRTVRDGLQAHLAAQGIPSMIYYPVPSHLQDAYRHFGYEQGDMPLTEQLTAEVISLPMHTELTDEQQVYIANAVKTYFIQAQPTV